MIAVNSTDEMQIDGKVSATPAVLLPPGVARSFVLVTSLFFLWGVPNAMNDVLIRQFMKSFSIGRFEAGLVQSAFYMGYFLLALPAGILMKKHGYKPGFMTGLLLFSTGCFLFLPAAYAGKFGFFLAALFVVASGLAFLETASNPFIAQLGPKATSEQRLNLAQAFNPLGCITGILLGTAFIFSGIELTPAQVAAKQAAGTYLAYTHMETLRVVSPYLVIGCVALVWAVLIGLTKFPAFLQESEHKAEVSGNWLDLRHETHFLLAVPAQFLYCGSQVCMWSYFIQYAKEYAQTSEKLAGVLLAGCLVSFTIGRFASTALMRRFTPSKLMTAYGLINVALLLVTVLWPSWAGLMGILVGSFFLSLMFPTIFAMGLKDIGANTNIAGSFIVMGIVGGAVLTPLMGLTAERIHSTAHAFIIPCLGNLGIAAYAFYMQGYDARRSRQLVAEV
jgi:FHS family L-fucose permease-like MFS transporter